MVLLSMFGLSDVLPSCKNLLVSLFFRLKHYFHAYILAKIGDQYYFPTTWETGLPTYVKFGVIAEYPAH